ncbi:Fic/DOC family protein [Thermoactinomyces sp. DSM 45891]|uniref:type II toxin-antitoxin system death-on-curing family toxin n=1 Tax=Thermoactinomyces sp. DSM 45891 TaxID=1761907 RepID=UPI00091151AF|nr:type II toxin-antitoxin system death-on-curing family toxin [Thermoactinomyces sp. DSM 45891]SFX30039.1 Fic/DOC family protein [Thermoactinomyces sp. DSM 45891]
MNQSQAREYLEKWISALCEKEMDKPNVHIVIDVDYLTVEEVVFAHSLVMKQFDEPENAGVLHPDRLIAAVKRPQMIHFGVEIHPNIWQKAGSLVQSIVNDHIFQNGNKRTAFACLYYFLDKNGYPLRFPPMLAEEFMVAIATNSWFKGDNGAKNIGVLLERLVKNYES